MSLFLELQEQSFARMRVDKLTRRLPESGAELTHSIEKIQPLQPTRISKYQRIQSIFKNRIEPEKKYIASVFFQQIQRFAHTSCIY